MLCNRRHQRTEIRVVAQRRRCDVGRPDDPQRVAAGCRLEVIEVMCIVPHPVSARESFPELLRVLWLVAFEKFFLQILRLLVGIQQGGRRRVGLRQGSSTPVRCACRVAARMAPVPGSDRPGDATTLGYCYPSLRGCRL
jgi:hypothetical protein